MSVYSGRTEQDSLIGEVVVLQGWFTGKQISPINKNCVVPTLI